MSDDKFEIKYYPEICEKMSRYLNDCFDGSNDLANSQNKQLNLMVNEIHEKLRIPKKQIFYPALKTDIAFGVKFRDTDLSFLLIEVKRGRTLSLIDYSQLIGYMQVARHIKVGVLMLVNEGSDASQLSGDFKNLIDIQQLLFDWNTTSTTTGESSYFRTGICVYTPGNGIDWVDSKHSGGISNWEMLRDCLTP